MLRTVKVYCVDCAAFQILRSEEVVVWSAHYALGYRFVCPDCEGIQSKPCSLRIFGLLSNHGCPFEYYARPLECDEPRASTPITRDEQLDLILAFHGDISAAIERELAV